MTLSHQKACKHILCDSTHTVIMLLENRRKDWDKLLANKKIKLRLLIV